jgi:hypothetical protein
MKKGMKKGDVVRAKQTLTMKEMCDFACVGIIEGIVLKKTPLIVEIDQGGQKFQVRIIDEAKEKFEVIKEAPEED